jgi:hypothetical protein
MRMTLDESFLGGIRSRLVELDGALDTIDTMVGQLRDVQPTDPGKAAEVIASACVLAQSVAADLRTAAGANAARWASRAEFTGALDGLVAKLRRAHSEAARMRFQNIADALASGSIKHWHEQQLLSWDELRRNASAESAKLAQADEPPDLPGPVEGAPWLAWAMALQDRGIEEHLARFEAAIPALIAFLCSVRVSNFVTLALAQPPTSAPSPQLSVAQAVTQERSDVPAVAARPVSAFAGLAEDVAAATSSPIQNGNGASALRKPAIPPVQIDALSVSPVRKPAPRELPTELRSFG